MKTIESIEIGDDCFLKVNTFRIDGLNHLKSLKIGIKSFTQQKDNWNTINSDSSRSFAILNCVELKSIEIGRYSFSGYSGSFELRNLPSLTSIKIGSIETDYSDTNNGGRSVNFCFISSLEIKGIIDMILLMNRSSTFEFDWIRWLCILLFIINSDIKYLNVLNEWIIDLPHLNSIKLGEGALAGRWDDSCSVLMESDIDINELIFRSS